MRLSVTALIFTALAGFSAGSAQSPPPVPDNLKPPAGERLARQAQATGDQIYTCDGSIWVLTAPEAKLLDDTGRQIGSHFAGPTWKLTDGSQVVGEMIASRPSPDAGSVAWLLLRAKSGTPTGRLADVAFIRGTETHGGVADPAGCLTTADAGKTVQVPYSATYSFYSEK